MMADKILLSEAELARKLGVPLNTVRRWRKTKGLPHVGVSRYFFYCLPNVLAWLDSQQSSENQLVEKHLLV